MKPLYQLPGDSSRLRVRRLVIVGSLLCGVLTFWIATQLFAFHVSYHPALGKPWVATPDAPPVIIGAAAFVTVLVAALSLLGTLPRPLAAPFLPLALLLGALAFGPIYSPAHLLLWTRRFASSPALLELLRSYRTSAFLVSIGILALAALAALVLAPPSKPDIHGSARFAKRSEIEGAKLLHPIKNESIVGPPGLFLGCWYNGRRKLSLYDAGDTHVFTFAPTRSGKGVSLVIPNLLMWQGSVLAIDLKAELYQVTSGWRSSELGSLCFRFDPTVPGTSRYNPLCEVRLGVNEVRDAQNVADVLVDPNGDKTRDHWDRTAHDLLTAVILHVLHSEPDKTLRGCAELLSRPGVDVADTLARIISTHGTRSVISSISQAVLDKSKDERSGVISTALSFLSLYRDPLIAANTEVSDFSISDLMNHDRPATLYLTLPPSDLSRTRPLIRLLLNQVCRRLTECELQFVDGRPVPHYRHKLLLLMDELPALGRLAFFAESLAFIAGYGMRGFLVAQDLSQLQGAYGQQESITSNAQYRIAFTPNRPQTADLLSQMAGVMTVHQLRRSHRAGGPLASASATVTPNESQRRLLTADEVMRLPSSEALIFAPGLPPILGSKHLYYQDPELRRRAAIAPPAALDRLPRHHLSG